MPLSATNALHIMPNHALRLLCLVLVCPGLAAAADVTASVTPLTRRPATAADHQGHEAVSQDGRLSHPRIAYGLRYAACWDASHAPGGTAGDTVYGMPLPTSGNWYGSGCLRLKINGQDLGQAKLADMWVAEQGRRGSIKMAFNHPLAAVVMTSMLYPDDDGLYVVISLSPKAAIDRLEVSLLSYPSFFTYWHKRDGDRKAMTATATYPQAPGKKIALDPAQQWWVAFTDTIFDPARGEGDGGCAVAFVPDQVSAAEVVVGSYDCPAVVQFKPDTRQIRLCLWDFNKRPNQEALAALTAALPRTLEQLRALNPLPLRIAETDIAGQAAGAQRQLGNLPGKEALAQRVTAQSEEIVRLRQELLDNRTPDPAAAEKALAEKLAAFEQLLWDVKFFVLIHG